MTSSKPCRECQSPLGPEDEGDICHKCLENLSPKDHQPKGEARLRTGLQLDFSPDRRYKTENEIGKGGMGHIYNVKDMSCRRNVAMKKMTASGKQTEHGIRFIEEAQITGQLQHPNVVPVYDLGVHRNEFFYTMKFVRGVTLNSILELLRKKNPQIVKKYPLSRLLTIFQKVCDAIRFAHSKGVIHRDLKPANIIVGNYGEVMVIDWGIAKIIGSNDTDNEESSSDVSDVMESLRKDEGVGFETMSGQVMGSPQFMSPEQADHKVASADQRSGIYALGAILYVMLTLNKPILGKNIKEILDKVIKGEVMPAHSYNKKKKGLSIRSKSNPNLPHMASGEIPLSLSAITSKAMACDPADRYQNVKDMQSDIEAFQNGYAPSIESAGYLKQVMLLIQRKKNEALLLLGSLGLITSILFFGLLGFNRYQGQYQQEKEMRTNLEQEQQRNLHREWKSILHEKFDTDSPSNAIKCTGGHVLLEDQSLVLNSSLGPGVLYLDVDLGRNFTIKFETWSLDSAQLHFSLKHKKDETHSYDMIVGKDFVSENQLLIDGVPGHRSGSKLLIPGKKQRFELLKKGNQFTLHLDDKTVFDYRIKSFPLHDPVIEIKIGVGGRRHFDNIEIHSLSVPRKLDRKLIIDELVDRKQHEYAFNVIESLLKENLDRESYALTLLSLINLSSTMPNHQSELLKRIMAHLVKYHERWPGKGIEVQESVKTKSTMYHDLSCFIYADIIDLNISPHDNSHFLSRLYQSLHASSLPARAFLNKYFNTPPEVVSLKIRFPLKDRFDFIKRFNPAHLQIEHSRFEKLDDINLRDLRYLSLSATSVKDLSRLEGSQIESLNVSHTPTEDLSPLAELSLKHLDVNHTLIKDLRALSRLNLKYLDIHHTSISKLDPLSRLNLVQLDISDTKVRDITALKHMPLKVFRANRCELRDFSALSGTPLMHAEFSHTLIEDLSFLSLSKELHTLSIAHTPVQDLEPIKSLPLSVLILSGTKVNTLKSLRDMRLNALSIEHTPIDTLEDLTQQTHLVSLNLSNTPIKDFKTLKSLSRLRDLKISIPGLNQFDFLKQIQLSKLDLSHTEIETLNVIYRLSKLTTLKINGTRIEDLSPLKNASLTHLEFKGTKVKDITPLASMPFLKHLALDIERYPYQKSILKHIDSLLTINGKAVAEFFKKDQ